MNSKRIQIDSIARLKKGIQKQNGPLFYLQANERIKMGVSTLVTALLLLVFSTVYADEWEAIAGTETLKAIYSDTEMLGVDWRAEFCTDGSSLQVGWGQTIHRTWKVNRDGQVCITTGVSTKCFIHERNIDRPNEYRCHIVGTQTYRWFKITDRRPTSCIKKKKENMVTTKGALDSKGISKTESSFFYFNGKAVAVKQIPEDNGSAHHGSTVGHLVSASKKSKYRSWRKNNGNRKAYSE
jgi:hypothetical protein